MRIENVGLWVLLVTGVLGNAVTARPWRDDGRAPGASGRRPDPLMAVLDADSDGTISATELAGRRPP